MVPGISEKCVASEELRWQQQTVPVILEDS